MAMKPEFNRIAELDKRLVESAKSIKILSQLSWPVSIAKEFVASVQTGNPQLPVISFKKFEYSEQIAQLEKVMEECDRSHPAENYIHKTANSYTIAAKMLQSVGTPAFTELSSQLYGTPLDQIGSTGVTNLLAAEHFIKATDEFSEGLKSERTETLTAEQMADRLNAMFVPFFKDHKVDIVIDPNLTSKAAAGANRVRLRGGSIFTNLDIGQLAHHEGFVHTATMLNGREQPVLKSMGLGAPRTTAMQEGLATFAEMITNTMDVSRLRRIALRIKGMHLAVDGANFIDVFKFFQSYGQDDEESCQSAARIFRGGDPRGGSIFTKDVVYLHGLMFLHTFLRKVIQRKKFHYAPLLFVGRLTLGDVISLEPLIDSGLIAPPKYLPDWVANSSCLAAYLCYSIFSNRINLSAVKLSDFSEDTLGE